MLNVFDTLRLKRDIGEIFYQLSEELNPFIDFSRTALEEIVKVRVFLKEAHRFVPPFRLPLYAIPLADPREGVRGRLQMPLKLCVLNCVKNLFEAWPWMES